MDETQLETVLREAQMGNAVAFGQVYGEFSNRVFGLCRKMLGSEAAAEDATSEVFERAYQSLDSYDRARPFDRWILTIASRHCLNRLRREKLERNLFRAQTADAPEPPAAAELAANTESAAPVTAASLTASPRAESPLAASSVTPSTLAPSPLAALETKEQRRMLLGAIEALPENYRLPLVLKYYGDLSYDEIAEQLGTTRNNVAVLLHRAKRELRAHVADLRKDER